MIEGRAFLLQAGDCVESFNELSTMRIREKLKIMLQMSAVLTYGATLPVVKVGRIAGQFTKPRSDAAERVGDEEIPSFRGHMVHDDAPTAEARIPDPERMVEGYNQSAATLNLLRAFTKGGYADLTQVHLWNKDFVASLTRRASATSSSPATSSARSRSWRRAGSTSPPSARLHEVDVYTSHEGLLLDYEEGLTRKDSLTGDWYDCSAHLLWIGERTRQPDGAHVEFFSGVHNPIGVKVGPTATPDELIELCRAAEPAARPGPPDVLSRAWAPSTCASCCRRSCARSRTRAIRSSGRATRCTATAITHRRRRQDAPLRRDHGRARGLLHRLLGGRRLARRRPPRVHRRGRDRVPRRRRRRARGAALLRYETLCDPRLNARQSLDLAFRLAELMRRSRRG